MPESRQVRRANSRKAKKPAIAKATRICKIDLEERIKSLEENQSKIFSALNKIINKTE